LCGSGDLCDPAFLPNGHDQRPTANAVMAFGCIFVPVSVEAIVRADRLRTIQWLLEGKPR